MPCGTMERGTTAVIALRASLILGSSLLALLQAVSQRFRMNPDGVSYLDIAAAYARGDWSDAINAYWSPLYSILLAAFATRAPPALEVVNTHLLNAAAFAFATLAFDFFLGSGIEAQRAPERGARLLPIPAWACYVVAYPFFLVAMLRWLGVGLVTPDICVAGLVYAAAGLLVRIHSGGARTWTFCALGGVLGLGFLAKAAMLPIGLAFAASAAATLRADPSGMRRAIVLISAVVLVGSPFVVALSAQEGQLTAGSTAVLNYAWFVSGVRPYEHWQGGPDGNGTPIHPTRQVLENPALYEFARPIAGSYPPWYAPSYWYEGVSPVPNAEGQRRVLMEAASLYWRMLRDLPIAAVVALGLALAGSLAAGGGRLRYTIRMWFLLMPGSLPFVLYALVHAETRFLAPFAVMLCVAALLTLRLPNWTWSRWLAGGWAVVIVLSFTPLAAQNAPAAGQAFRELSGGSLAGGNPFAQVATELSHAGVAPGQTVGFIGYGFDAYWAHVAHVKIVAELPLEEVPILRTADTDTRARAVHALESTGAVAVVTDQLLPEVLEWTPVGGGYYVHLVAQEQPARGSEQTSR
jgi:hypothetical protein